MWYSHVFILGLLIGSFANVLIYRLPRGLSPAVGRSHCVHCGRTLAWYDLFPLVSFFLLRGRCRNCKKQISSVYPLVELYSGVIWVGSYFLFANSGIVYWIFTVFLLETFLVLALTDLKNLILPDSVMLATLFVVMFAGLLNKFDFLKFPAGFRIVSLENLIGAAVAFVLFFLIWLLSGGRAMGLGDVKLAGLIGLIFGLLGGLLILYGAIALGAVIGLFLLLVKRAGLKTKLPLGTFISISASLYLFFGSYVSDYLSYRIFLVKNIWP